MPHDRSAWRGRGQPRAPLVAPGAVALVARRSAAIAVSLAGLVLAVTVGRGPRPAHSQDECVVIEDFRRAPVGQFPPDWKPRKESGRAVYAVQAEGEGKFLRATARDV